MSPFQAALHVQSIPDCPPLHELFARLEGEPDAFVLESGSNPAEMGRWHLLGAGAIGFFRVTGECWESRIGDDVNRGNEDPWNAFEAWWRAWSRPGRQAPGEPPVVGGAFGYIGYEFGERVEGLPPREGEDADAMLPDVDLRLYDEVLCVDAITGAGTFFHRGRDGVERRRWWAREVSSRGSAGAGAPRTRASNATEVEFSIPDDDYVGAVASIRRSIGDGDVYEVNLTRREVWPRAVDPWTLHRALRARQPVPYAAVLPWEPCAVVSASPERFLRRRGTHVETRPIKGTAARTGEAAADARAASALLSSEKERAELAMIIDLERNDLGKVAIPGSVRVEEEAGLEEYSTVIHTVATVVCEVDRDLSPVALLRATFPGGSITGAPKIAAMQFIRALEPVPRKVYTGSVGWIGPSGDLDLSIAIRTVLITHDRTMVSVGGAVTWGSDPRAEVRELEAKGRAIRASLAELQ